MSNINNINNIEQRIMNQINAGNSTGNPSVQSSSNFSSFMVEKKSMDDIFEEAAQKFKVPVNLLKAIAKAESNFNEKAVSRAGAQGVMQLMPATAASLGVTDPFDAEQNIMGGAKYISDLLKKYDGDVTLALAAYNAGMGNVRKYGGVPPFKETQNYVVKVTNFMKQGPVQVTNNKSFPSKTPNVPTVAAPSNSSNIEINNQTEIEELSGELDEVFSYDLYMKFLEKFLENTRQREDAQRTNSRNRNQSMPALDMMRLVR